MRAEGVVCRLRAMCCKPRCNLSPPVLLQAPLYLRTSRRYRNVLLLLLSLLKAHKSIFVLSYHYKKRTVNFHCQTITHKKTTSILYVTLV